MDRHPVLERSPRSCDHPSAHEAEAFGDRLRPRDLELNPLGQRQCAGPKLPQVGPGVNETEIIPRGSLWLDDRKWATDPALQEPRMDHPVFARGKDVSADINRVARGIDGRHPSRLCMVFLASLKSSKEDTP